MKKFYSLVLTLVALVVVSFSSKAAEYTITLNIQNPEGIKLEWQTSGSSGYEYVEETGYTLVEGENEITGEDGASLCVSAKDGWLITRAYNNIWGMDMYGPGGKYTIYISSSAVGVYDFVAEKEASFRNGEFTLTVEDASTISCGFPATTTYPTLVDGVNKIEFNPDEESEFFIASTGRKPIYQVTQNSTPVAATNGDTWFLTVADGDAIEVVTTFPDQNVPFLFEFVNEGTEGIVTSFIVDGTEVPASEYLADNFEVKLGAQYTITLDVENYELEDFGVNDSYPYIEDSYTGYVTEPVVITIDAVKDAVASFYKIIRVNNPEAVTVFEGEYTNNPDAAIEFDDEGEAQILVTASAPYVAVAVKSGYYIESIIDNDEDITDTITDTNAVITLAEEGELEIVVKEIVFEDSFVIYFDSNPADLAYFAFNNSKRESFAAGVGEGYNFVDFIPAWMPFSITWAGADFNNLYINDEKAEGVSGADSNYRLDLKNGDVVKVFHAADVQPVALSFKTADDVEVAAVRDHVTAIDNLNGTIDVLPGSHVKVSSATDAKFVVTVGTAEPVTADEHEFVVTEDTHVVIAAPSVSAVAGVAVTEGDINAPVYNLQGIRVASKAEFNQLPAGIYVVEGVKTVKK